MEQYFNDYGTTLSAGITNSQTTLNVTSTYGYPSTGNFRIRIDSELLLVTAISGSTWTVTRGIEATSAATHLTGATISSFLTAGALAQLFIEQGGAGSNFSWQGTWANGTTYGINNVVFFNGSSYVNKVAGNIGNAPDANPSMWSLLAQPSAGVSWKGLWVSGTTYNQTDGVYYNGSAYVALIGSNTGNIPSTSPSQWSIFAQGLYWRGTWSSGTSYNLYDIVFYNNSTYSSSVTSNANNNPATSPSQWTLVAQGTTWKSVWASGTTYNLNDIIFYNNSTYISLVATNTNNNPATATSSWSLVAQGMTWKAVWSSGSTYNLNDIVY